MMRKIRTFASCATRVFGGVGSGKTNWLLEHVAALIKQGIEPSAIEVLCATPDAAKAFSERLQTFFPEMNKGISVSTPRQVALSTLRTKEAKIFTGREARILADFEYGFLFEDMKTFGLKPHRLHEMLDFIYRGMTELADWDEDWLIGSEEHEVHEFLNENLRFYDGMLEYEISKCAVEYLLENDTVQKELGVGHVLVDDYQNLSRASQFLASCRANDSIVIAGNAHECMEVLDPFPYPEGLEEFAAIHKNCKTVELDTSYLPHEVNHVIQQLLDDDSMEALRASQTRNDSLGAFSVHRFEYIEDEIKGITQILNRLVKEKSYEQSKIHVVVPNEIWGNAIASSLKAAGHNSTMKPMGQTLKGDIRHRDRCSSLRLFTALRLVADPTDAVAWRCWCGYGDYLTKSNCFSKLRKLSREKSLNVFELLKHLNEQGDSSIAGFDDIDKRYSEGVKLVECARGVCGPKLLRLLARELNVEEIPEQIYTLCASVSQDDSALALMEQAEEMLLMPRFSSNGQLIKIGGAGSVCGLSPHTVLFSGFVDGFILTREYFDTTQTTFSKQKELYAHANRSLYSTLGKATNRVIITHFSKTELENAEKLKLRIERIRLEDGVRVCSIFPSEFLSQITNHGETVE